MSRSQMFDLVVDAQSELESLKKRHALEKGALEAQVQDQSTQLHEYVELVRQLEEDSAERQEDLDSMVEKEADMRSTCHELRQNNHQFLLQLKNQQKLINYQGSVINKCTCASIDSEQSLVLHNTTQMLTNKSNLLGDVTAPFRPGEVDETVVDVTDTDAADAADIDNNLDTINSSLSNITGDIVDLDGTVHDVNGLWSLNLSEDAHRALDA